MKTKITLELDLSQSHPYHSNPNLARFELKPLDNGCYTLASFFDHNYLHHVLTDWLKLHNNAENLAQLNNFNEYCLKMAKTDEKRKDDEVFTLSIPKRNVSEVVKKSTNIDCIIPDETSLNDLDS